MVLLALFGVKFLFITPTYTELGVIAALGALSALMFYKDEKRTREEMQKENAKRDEKIQDLEKKLESVATAVASVKLATGMRSVNGGQR